MTTPATPIYRKPYTPRTSYRCDPALITAAKSEYEAEIKKRGIAFGHCCCGCPGITRVPTQNVAARGWFVGVPVLFLTGHARRRSPIRMIVEDRGYITPCHVWQWAHHPAGYGVMRVNGRNQSAHRFEYEKVHGPIPKKMYIDHLCRVPACINVDHLEMVTNAENIRRGLRASITEVDVERLFALRRTGLTWKAIAPMVGVTYENARAIACGKRWGDVRERILREQNCILK